MELTPKAKGILELAKRIAKKKGQGYVGTEHLLWAIMGEGSTAAAKILEENGVTEPKLAELIDQLISFDGETAVKEGGEYSPRFGMVMDEAYRMALQLGDGSVGTEHMLMGIIREGESVANRLLTTLGVNGQKAYLECLAAMGHDPAPHADDLSKKAQGPAEAGVLANYSKDLTQAAMVGDLDPTIGREREIQRLMQVLCRRTKNNPCLLGEPGVGKSAVVEGFAERLAQGRVPIALQGKRLLSLDLSSMVAGTKYRGEFEERIKRVIREVIEAGNIILFMDEMHTLIGAGGAEGSLDAANILKPALARGEVQLIGATTIAEYRKYVEKDAALERRFQPVDIEEPSPEEAVEILEGIKYRYEAHHNLGISREAVEAAVALSIRYIHDRNLPDKAIDLMDEAAARAGMGRGYRDASMQAYESLRRLDLQLEEALTLGRMDQAAEFRQKQHKVIRQLEKKQRELQKKRFLQPDIVIGRAEIEAAVAMWTKIPVEKIAEKESERLLRLEETLHKRVIGQEKAVSSLAKAVRRGRAGLKDPKRPIGSFLFLGPTGVGKTELSKALAQAMFGSEDALIRVDMSEYMEGHSVSKMIGSPPGYVGHQEGGQLSDKVRSHPYSVILFDEVEKAHPDVFNVLLQVLDDGHITDSKGRKVDFKNTILIMTSNAGAQRIVDPKKLGFAIGDTPKADYERMKSSVMEEVKRSFKPEFLNRIDDIIVFHQLDKEHMRLIVDLLISQLARRCQDQMGLQLRVTTALREHLVEKYADAKMGARPLKRALQSVVEDGLAEELLSGRISAGDGVRVGYSKGEVRFHKIEG